MAIFSEISLQAAIFRRKLRGLFWIYLVNNFYRFTGGLNLSGSDGEQSLYTTFNNREIMFHVSTMLPTSSDPEDRQQVKHAAGANRKMVNRCGTTNHK